MLGSLVDAEDVLQCGGLLRARSAGADCRSWSAAGTVIVRNRGVIRQA
jgi:hypothetical protein